MQASLSSLAQRCAESGMDIADEDVGAHWGRLVAALMACEPSFDRRSEAVADDVTTADRDLPS